MNKNNKRKNQGKPRRARNNNRVGLRQLLAITDQASYAGLQRTRLTIPGTPVLLSTTVTSGLIASTQAVQKTSISSFATRFATTYDEYRFVGCNYKCRAVGPNPGVGVVWFDEKSNSTATLTDSQEKTGRRFPFNSGNSKSDFVMRWRANDLVDLQWSAIATTQTPAYFKIYSDNANYGASIVATPYLLIEPEYIVEFRGLQGS